MPQLSDALGIFAPNIFRDTTALITGGGRGIGREIALAFARLGANVVIASRNENNLKPTAEDIEAMGGACLAVPTNIRETDHVEALVERALDRFGAIDVLVNNAGGQFPARATSATGVGGR